MDFEDLINNAQSESEESKKIIAKLKEPKIVNSIQRRKNLPITKYNDNSNLYQFIEKVAELVTKSMRDIDIDFQLDEGKRMATAPSHKINGTIITFKVITRKILDEGTSGKENKPRIREEFLEETEQGNRYGHIYGQKFDAIVQFNFFASEYKIAEQVMNRFESLMIDYAKAFVEQGITDVIFHEQLTDEVYDIYREILSVRNLRYRIIYEKQHVTYDEIIDEVDVI